MNGSVHGIANRDPLHSHGEAPSLVACSGRPLVGFAWNFPSTSPQLTGQVAASEAPHRSSSESQVKQSLVAVIA